MVAVLQTLNQRPNAGPMMNLPGMQNKMGGIGMVSVQQGGPIGQMPVQTLNAPLHAPLQGQINNQMAQINMTIGPQIHSQLNHMQQRKVCLLSKVNFW